MISIGKEYDAYVYANTKQLNTAEAKINSFKKYFIPPNCSLEYISVWEQSLKIKYFGSLPSLQMRNTIVQSRLKNHPSLRKEDFYNIALELGWDKTNSPTILIEDGLNKPFRLGISRLGIDGLTTLADNSPYEIRVTYEDSGDDNLNNFLEYIFDDLKPIETKMNFIQV